MKSVMHGQCDAILSVTFPDAKRRRTLTGTKSYCLVTGVHRCEQLAWSGYWAALRPRIEPETSGLQVRCPNRWAAPRQADSHLFLVVFFQRVVVSFLEPAERDVDFGRPPDLDTAERHLSGEVEQPLFPRLVVVRRHGLGQLVLNRAAHRVQHAVQPDLHLRTRQRR